MNLIVVNIFNLPSRVGFKRKNSVLNEFAMRCFRYSSREKKAKFPFYTQI